MNQEFDARDYVNVGDAFQKLCYTWDGIRYFETSSVVTKVTKCYVTLAGQRRGRSGRYKLRLSDGEPFIHMSYDNWTLVM